MKIAVVQVRMSELHTQQLTIPPWEVAVLQAVHGTDDVHVIGNVSQDREPPDAATEYNRLERRYGTDREQGGVSFVAQVYGQHGAGVNRLAEEIERAAAATVRKRDAKEATA